MLRLAYADKTCVRAEATGEPSPAHSYEDFEPRIPDLIDRTPALDG